MLEWQKNMNQAYKLFDQKRYAEALVYFDLVENSNCTPETQFDLYNERGNCLQALNYHLDAIDDFTKLIEMYPGSANPYFMRSLSYLMLGDYSEAWKDNFTAIQLSKANTKENTEANERAKKNGYDTATLFYQLRLDFVKQQAEMSELVREQIAKPRIRRTR